MSRWDYLEGVKAETPTKVAVRELGRILVEELSAWPPEVDWLDASMRKRFACLYVPFTAPPSESVVVESLRRVRWELTRDFEAIDHYERNHHLEKACPGKNDRAARDLIANYLYEALLQLIERTENRVKRSELVDGLPLLEAGLRAAWRRKGF